MEEYGGGGGGGGDVDCSGAGGGGGFVESVKKTINRRSAFPFLHFHKSFHSTFLAINIIYHIKVISVHMQSQSDL